MPQYVIERTIPGAGNLTPDELQGISAKSVEVLEGLEGAEWLHSYVVADKIFCVYEATGEDVIREHGRCGGFPVDAVHEVGAVITPQTARA